MNHPAVWITCNFSVPGPFDDRYERRRGHRRGCLWRRGRRWWQLQCGWTWWCDRAIVSKCIANLRCHCQRALPVEKLAAARLCTLFQFAIVEGVHILRPDVRPFAGVEAEGRAQRRDHANANDEAKRPPVLQHGLANLPVHLALARRAGADDSRFRNDVGALPDRHGDRLGGRRRWRKVAQRMADGSWRRRWSDRHCDGHQPVCEVGTARMQRRVHGRVGRRGRARHKDAPGLGRVVD